MVRILLADDHEVIRRGLRGLIESKHPCWEVCGEACESREAVDLALELKPDIVVLDLGMPELGDGLEALRQIRRLLPQTEILVFSMYDNEHTMREARAAGANGYVAKSDDGLHVLAALEALAQHRPYVSGLVAPAALSPRRASGSSAPAMPAPKKGLTKRQREVTRLLARGRTNQEIADILAISIRTAKTHRAAIMNRLEANSTVDIVLYALRTGLVALF